MENKKTILGTLLMAFFLAAIPIQAADLSSGNFQINTGSGGFSIVNPGNEYSNTFSLETSMVSWETCADNDNYMTGRCDYLYGCYIILPKGCSSPDCSIDYECTQILSLENPELVPVSYIPSLGEVGAEYAVVAFLIKSEMSYDWVTGMWSDYSYIIEDTRQADTVEVPTPPQPIPPETSGIIGDIWDAVIGPLLGFLESLLGWIWG